MIKLKEGESMIKNVIFDIGRVLVTYEPIKYFYPIYKEKSEPLCQIIFNSEEWLKLDQGLYDEKKVMECLTEQYPQYSDEIQAIVTNWTHMMDLKEDTYFWLCDLKREQYGVYLLSNIGEHSFQTLAGRFDFFELVDGGVFSYREHCLKPDPKIFQTLLSRYGLKAEECVFIDDNKENVVAAKKLGFHAILFQDQKQAKKEWEEMMKVSVC